MAAIYDADIYCDDCAEEIKERITRMIWSEPMDSILPDGTTRADFESLEELKDHLEGMDERTYDSGEYPKCCGDNEESDSPQHCGSHDDCVNAGELSDGFRYGYCFGNELTSDGNDYVREAVDADLLAGCTDSVAVEVWMEVYDYLDYVEQCAACGEYVDYGGLDCNDECAECCEGSEFEDEPEDGDYTITPCGPLGGKSGSGGSVAVMSASSILTIRQL